MKRFLHLTSTIEGVYVGDTSPNLTPIGVPGAEFPRAELVADV